MASRSTSEVVRGAIGAAIERAGKAAALASAIERDLGRPYNHRTVSAWGRGDAMPPADAFVSALRTMAVSLDEELEQGGALRSELEALRVEVGQLAAAMRQR